MKDSGIMVGPGTQPVTEAPSDPLGTNCTVCRADNNVCAS